MNPLNISKNFPAPPAAFPLRLMGQAGLGMLLLWISPVVQLCRASDEQTQAIAAKAVAILQLHCSSCHGAEKQESGLRVDSRESLWRGGERGSALQLKSVDSAQTALLLASVDGSHEELSMPPKRPLSEAEMETLRLWFSADAPWPAPIEVMPEAALLDEASSETVQTSRPFRLDDAWTNLQNPVHKRFSGERLDLWSLQPISLPAIPHVEDPRWAFNPIDRFLISEWASHDRQPAADLDARALIRRLSLGLTGLPPTYEEVAQFVQDASPEAYCQLVDSLLNSPRYGEHRGRMWLDVVRYSDSNGFDWDEFRPEAWRFRDYVIDSFNRDLPFDEFVRQQLAGDEALPAAPDSMDQRDWLIATGYLRLGPHDNAAGLFDEQDRSRAELMADLTETTGSAFLGLTLACCRCHDHKTEPLLQSDHYRFRAFFAAVQFADDMPLDLVEERERIAKHNSKLDEQTKQLEATQLTLIEKVKRRLTQTRVEVHSRPALDQREPDRTGSNKPAGDSERKAKTGSEVTDKQAKAAFTESEKTAFEDAAREKALLESQRLKYEHGLLITDKDSDIPATHILYQGNHKEPREAVETGFPSVWNPHRASVATVKRIGSSGLRTTLADWIVHKENPLTARVLVNRLWQAHFGDGIIETPNDFGYSGAPPTYPALLDWLAREFIDSGWSVKYIERLIVTSHAYRQIAVSDSRKDHRIASPREKLNRLTAEQLRDAVLAASGLWIASDGGPPVWPELPAEVLQANPAFLDDNAAKTKGWYPSPAERQHVRSIYLVQKRTVKIPFLEAFDLPDNSTSCARRDHSIVAPQALTLLNSPLMQSACHALADRIESCDPENDAQRISLTYQHCFQRLPLTDELRECHAFLKERTLAELCRVLLNSNEFIFVD